MNKNIYIINTENDIYHLLPFFEELQKRNFKLLFFLQNSKIFKVTQEKKISIKKIPSFFNSNSKFKIFIFKFLSPFISLFLIPIFLYLKQKKKLDLIICFGNLEKIILRIPLSLLNIQTVWFENNNKQKPLKFFSKKIKRICFNELNKNNLIKQKIKKEKISILNPGLNTRDTKRQDNIFNNLAHKNSSLKKESKFFTIGTFANLNLENNLENLFLAVKKALIVIPNIQLIIIGDGEKRKKLSWLSKKMQIDNVVWFVGEQERMNKWLDTFDIFIVSCKKTQLEDFNILLKILNSKIPVISPFGIGFNDIIKDNKNGLITQKEESEEILEAIIKLKKDKYARKRLGENGFLTIQNELNIEKMVEKFLNIIKINE